jgi:hypothetical protein
MPRCLSQFTSPHLRTRHSPPSAINESASFSFHAHSTYHQSPTTHPIDVHTKLSPPLHVFSSLSNTAHNQIPLLHSLAPLSYLHYTNFIIPFFFHDTFSFLRRDKPKSRNRTCLYGGQRRGGPVFSQKSFAHIILCYLNWIYVDLLGGGKANGDRVIAARGSWMMDG